MHLYLFGRIVNSNKKGPTLAQDEGRELKYRNQQTTDSEADVHEKALNGENEQDHTMPTVMSIGRRR